MKLLHCPQPPRWALALAVASIVLGAWDLASAQDSLAGNSPFLPAGGSASQSGGPPADYVLAGSSVSGGVAQVCVVQSDTKRSRWIAVGETVDGIQVISFDADHDRAVVIAHGARKELTLRKAAVSSLPSVAFTPAPGPTAPVLPLMAGSPAAGPVSAPTSAPPPLPPPGTEARAETEARMMVSDLLEIGMQQRKAYEDARNQPAGSAPAQPPK